jgi:hypothetical protein
MLVRLNNITFGTRNSILLLAALVVIGGALGLLRFNILQVGGTHDDAQYVVLAESLGSGQGYRLINFPEPAENISFPPGWPILLAPLAAVFPANYSVLKLVSFGFWLASIVLVYKLFESHLKSPYLAIVSLLVATNSLLVAASTMLMAESAYVFFSLLTLYLYQYWNKRYQGATNWLVPVIAFSAVYTQLIRTIGLSVMLAVLSALLLSRRVRQFLIMAGLMVVGLLPQIWLNTQRGGLLFSGHYEELSVGSSSLISKLGMAFETALAYFDTLIVDSVFPLIFSERVTSVFSGAGLEILLSLFNYTVLAVMLIGLIRSLLKLNIWDLYVGFYFAGILVFRNPAMGVAQPRFLIPLIPFIYYYLVQGALWLAALVFRRNDRRILVTVVCLSAMLILLSLTDNITSWQNPVRAITTDLSVGTNWIRENSPADAVVMAEDPISRYLYTRRKTVEIPKAGYDLETYIENLGVDYIIISPILQTPLTTELEPHVGSEVVPYLGTNPDRFMGVFSNPTHNVSIYKVMDETANISLDG